MVNTAGTYSCGKAPIWTRLPSRTSESVGQIAQKRRKPGACNTGLSVGQAVHSGLARAAGSLPTRVFARTWDFPSSVKRYSDGKFTPMNIYKRPTKRKRAPMGEETYRVIRARLAEGEFQHDIAADLGLNQGRVSEVNTGKRGSDPTQGSLL